MFSPATQSWFESTFPGPTPVQERGWPVIAQGRHALLLAPTGGGKTLAAFLWWMDRLGTRPPTAPGVRVVYVSPLKALVYDVERNLRAPLVGIQKAAERLGVPFQPPRVDLRTGDTPSADRRRQTREPGEILVTTPESLYLLLGSRAGANLRTVEAVIVDEIHALAGDKRGVHLALTLERLAELADRDPRRLGLSATVRPADEVARFLGGRRPVTVVDTAEPPKLDLRIEVPLEDMARPARSSGSVLGQMARAEAAGSVWPWIYPRLLEQIQQHRSTLLFVNSRGLCERLARNLNELAGTPLVRAHHGSVSHCQRSEIEEALKAGTLRAIVATSSLELGIDMAAVDQVLLVESPGSVARGLQRIGRAGHRVGRVSVGRIFPKFRGDLLECAVVAREMLRGNLEPLRTPRNALDVLAQQVVAMTSDQPWSVERLLEVVRRAHPYRELSRDLLVAVLDMLSGRYPSTEFAELKPLVNWDRARDLVRARPGSKSLALVNAGTIPDRGLYSVHVAPDGPRVGELDEEMVYETRPGQNLMLGATTWHVEEVTRDRVLVTPAPGQPGRLPFWKGEVPGRPLPLGRAMGEFLHEAARQSDLEGWLRQECPLDAPAARNLAAYLREQREATGMLPTHRDLVVECFRDELGDWRVCLLSFYGARVHGPWALAAEAALARRAGYSVESLWTDDGMVFRFAESDELPDLSFLALDPDEVEDRVVEQLGDSPLFAARFRENAARALLLPRRRPGRRTPLWAQRLRAQQLLGAAREHPSFPLLLETYRTCLQDLFDLPALREILERIRRREIRLVEVETPTPSPFARSLVFAYVARYLYEEDRAPAAERKAQALTLDRNLLRELLGQEALRDLLDPEVIREVTEERQGLTRPARHADALHDLLRRVGDLSEAELRERSQVSPENLEAQRRAVRLRVAGESRWIAAEEAGLYRDALGAQPPPGLPAAFLEEVPQALERLLHRYARTHGPFLTAEVARRFGLAPAQAAPALQLLAEQGKLLRGEFRPGGSEREWCDPEVLREIRRRTLARLRREAAPLEPAVLGRFLPRWQGLDRPADRLEPALEALEGVPLPVRELQRTVLPARVRGYHPRLLDELGATGQWVWVGCGRERIALFRRDRVALLLDPPAEPEGVHRGILEYLEERGASFFTELARSLGGEDLSEPLWELVWAGLVTNDTFAPLWASRRSPVRRRRITATSGRWSLVSRLLEPAPADAEKAHARAVNLLQRYGVVSRSTAAGLYPVLQAMEEAGKVRRGYFIEGLPGAQFAWPGAVELLRALREPPEGLTVQLLAAADPANPYGALLPWPSSPGNPRRAPGASVVLVQGRAVLFVEGRSVTVFEGVEEEAVQRAAGALRPLAAHTRGGVLRITRIDGQPAGHSPWAAVLRRAGFCPEYPGLALAG